jgi:hypothetical protein
MPPDLKEPLGIVAEIAVSGPGGQDEMTGVQPERIGCDARVRGDPTLPGWEHGFEPLQEIFI